MLRTSEHGRSTSGSHGQAWWLTFAASPTLPGAGVYHSSRILGSQEHQAVALGPRPAGMASGSPRRGAQATPHPGVAVAAFQARIRFGGV